MQRCAAHCASKTDIEETFEAGKQAVRAAVNGETDKMVCYARKEGDKYECEYKLLPLELAANTEKTVPMEWIINNGTGISDEFVKYALPLIQGEVNMKKEDGLPRFAKLKKVLVEKK
jgi:6-phosphofructokinase 1